MTSTHAMGPDLLAELRALNASLDGGSSLASVIEHVCQAACRLGAFERAGVALYSPASDELAADPEHMHPASVRYEKVRRASFKEWHDACACRLHDRRQPLAVTTGDPACPCPCAWPAESGRNTPRICAALQTGTTLVGILWADNGISESPLPEGSADRLQTWAECTSGLLLAAQRASEFTRRARISQRLAEVAAAIAASVSLDDILLMVRSAILETGILDRVGIFLYDEERRVLVGTWGTDRAGNLEDLHSRVLEPTFSPDAPIYRVVLGLEPYVLSHDLTRQRNLPEHHPMHGVRAHCALPLAAGSKVLGVLVGDNLLSDRPITEDDVGLILPFARQAAVAIVNADLTRSLLASREHLEEQVRLRTRDVEALNAEIAYLLSALSHDMRSPIRAAEGFISEILTSHRDTLTPEVRRDVERVHRAAVRLGSLIDRLLALSRLSRRRPEPRTLALDTVVMEVVRELRPSYRHACEVDIRPMPQVQADPGLIRLLYHELLDNAFRATEDATHARIEVGYEDGEYYVRDNGVGFEPEYAQTLFDVFRRYDYARETTGAGLALARRVVALHGGTIRAEGAPGRGATFWFTIAHHPSDGGLAVPSVLTHAEGDERGDRAAS